MPPSSPPEEVIPNKNQQKLFQSSLKAYALAQVILY
jgi:hypothetical protein